MDLMKKVRQTATGAGPAPVVKLIQAAIMRTRAAAICEIFAPGHLRFFELGLLTGAGQVSRSSQKSIQVRMQNVAKFQSIVADVFVARAHGAVRFNGQVAAHAFAGQHTGAGRTTGQDADEAAQLANVDSVSIIRRPAAEQLPEESDIICPG